MLRALRSGEIVAAAPQRVHLQLAGGPGAVALAHARLERVVGLGAAAARDSVEELAALLGRGGGRTRVRAALRWGSRRFNT